MMKNKTSFVPGTMMRVAAHGDRILLAKVGGDFYAICDTCSHEETSPYMGAVHGEYVQCRLHASRFSINAGAPLEEPAEERVSVYPVGLEGDDIFIGPCK